jgi:ATP-binding cassette subfamily F protein 3
VVSHNRHFLDEVVSKVWRVGAGDVHQFEGNYSDYLWQMDHGTRRAGEQPILSGPAAPRPILASDTTTTAPSNTSASGPKSKEQKRLEAEERARKRDEKVAAAGSKAAGMNDYQLRKEYAKAEAAVEKQENRVAEIEAQLADPSLFTDAIKGKRLMADYEESQRRLQEHMKWWEELAEAMTARELNP